MAVAAVDQYAQDPYKAPTSSTVPKTNVTQTPTPTVQPQVAQQQAPRAAATTTLVPSQVPQMDPMAFQTSPNSYQSFPTPYTGGYNPNPVSMAREEGGYQYGSYGTRRPILGVDQTYGTPVYGDWEDVNQVGQFDPNTGAALWRGGDAYTQGQYQTRQDIANMTEAQRQTAFDALLAKYGGSLSQGNAGVALPSTATADDAAAFNYLQQLTNAAKYSPDNLKALTSNSNIYNSPLTEAEAPEFFAKYGINDPNYRSPTPTPINNGYRTIQGGQEFTDPALAMDAFNKLKQSGDTLFTELQPGGTWRPDAYAQVQAGQTGGAVPGTPGAPGTPGTPGGPGIPVDTGGDSVYPGGGASGGGDSGLGPTGTAADPEFDLRSLQILPSEMLDRFKLAQEQYGTFADSTSPQYQAALRDAARAAAATGRLGSGMLRTSYGDLANTRARELTNQRDTLFQNALLGSVQDAQTRFEDLLAEQQYQTGAQNQAFNQAITAQRLQEELTSGAFERALSQMIQGYSNDPSQMSLTLSKIMGDQSSAAGQALATLMMGLGSGGGDNSEMMKLLKQIRDSMQPGGVTVTPQGTPGSIPTPQLPTQFPTDKRPSNYPVS